MSMTKIKADQWQAVSAGEVLELDLGERATLLIHHAIPDPSEVLVHAYTQEGKRIPVHFVSGNGTTRLNLVGFQRVDLIAEADSGLAVSLDNGEHFELFDELPPPEPKLPSNALARMRAAFRSQLGLSREEFLTGDELLGYELPEDAPAIFEEEEQARARAARRPMKEEQHGSAERSEDRAAEQVDLVDPSGDGSEPASPAS